MPAPCQAHGERHEQQHGDHHGDAAGPARGVPGEAWQQAARTCTEAAGTITHHHGVGRLKAPFLTGELGETGTGVLTAIRKALDPAGIMNPKGLTS